eukprot:404986_1
MSHKKHKRKSNTTNTPPSKKQKLNNDIKIDSSEILSNLDLDMNIVVGRNKTPINLNFYNPNMKEIQIDQHIYFQFNPDSYAHNILWKNKVLLKPQIYTKFKYLITKRNKRFCHFHQPSPKQILDMYNMAPTSIKHSQSCCTILYNIHKSVMSTLSEESYRNRKRRVLQQELTNLDIPNHSIHTFLNTMNNNTNNNNQDDKINEFLENDDNDDESKTLTQNPYKSDHSKSWTDIIEDYGFKDNIFHKLSKKYRISPMLLIREFLKLNFAISGNNAKAICILLSQKINKPNMSDIKDEIFKLYGVTFSIAILNAIFVGVMTDCIRGYNQNIAWLGWNNKVKQSGTKILKGMVMGKGAHFLEHTLIGKFRSIIVKINEKIEDEKDKIKILNESEQKLKISELRQEKIRGYKQVNGILDENGNELKDFEILQKVGWNDPPTPDLLFNRPVMINGTFIHWMDAKNFLITHQDKVKNRKILKQVAKYNKAFGNGAIVCLGFVEQPIKFQKSVMLLDSSYWELSLE